VKAGKGWLEVKKSTLPRAGRGLFARRTFRRGQRITEYKGRLCRWKDVAATDAANPYLMRVNRLWAIDARPALNTRGRYANDAAGTPGKNSRHNNAVYVTVGRRCYIEATKTILPGDEILVSYGKAFWKLHGKKSGLNLNLRC
jgi:SET domain-containing protein